ncbi:haloalkane dehalogenase [Sphingomonas jatrophae]|uniref:Haloalkane dehalogenase n=1 Tax=Sphingomonas jatrophae TaxID=1166337 RepID=A0A1I6KHI4_9SPHN|nr:haloalkane dehalogenase [Sphingomonas jatrophae]SFR90699.1 haloalkane dehalogenase [Sphingomonas jatrophae]
MEIRPGVLRTPDARFADLPDFPFAPHYVEVPGGALGPLRMHYLDEGPADAAPVLMLHGNPTWSFLYRHMIRPLADAGHRVIVPDMIGFGRSDKPADRSAYSYDRFVGWMGAFVDALDLTGITLVCQDWGGPIGFRILAERPDRFAAVFATNTLLPNCEPPPRGIEGWPGPGIEAWIETCRTSSDLPAGELVAGASLHRPASDVLAGYDAPFPEAAYKAGLLQITCGIPVSEAAEGLMANRAAWALLERWDRPFATAFSDGDPATAAWAPVFRRRVPGAAQCAHPVIERAGHFVQEEQGPALAAELLRFLDA